MHATQLTLLWHKSWPAFLMIVALAAILGAAFGSADHPRYDGRSLRYWLGELASEDYQARLRAETALRGLGLEALPELTRVAGARRSALGLAWRRVREACFPASRSRPSPDRLAAAAARLLAGLGAGAAPASAALVRMLTEGSPAAAREAETALRGIGLPAAGHLAGGLARGTPLTQGRILQLLAASAEVGFGAGVPDLSREVARLGAAPDPSVRLQAVAAYAALQTDAPGTISFLMGRLADDDVTVRCAAAAALGRLGSAALAAQDSLVALLHRGSAPERAEAAGALWEISRDAALILPVLVSSLGEDGFRSVAALTLGKMGAFAGAAVPAMLAALAEEKTHRPSRTPSLVAVALGKAGPSAVPGLIALTGHPEADVRINAAFALRGQGTNAVAAVPALGRMLGAKDPEERMSAADALAAIGPSARGAEAELLRLAEETSGDVIVGHVASSARVALRRIRETAGDTHEALP